MPINDAMRLAGSPLHDGGQKGASRSSRLLRGGVYTEGVQRLLTRVDRQSGMKDVRDFDSPLLPTLTSLGGASGVLLDGRVLQMLRIPLHNGRSPTKTGYLTRGRPSSKLVKRVAIVAAFLLFAFYLFAKTFNPRRALSTKPQGQGQIDRINPNRTPKPRAKFVILVRERELADLLPSIRDLQWAFNDDLEHGYDYVLLSEKPFSDYFKDKISDFLAKRPSKPQAQFGLVPKEDWDVPAHIDMEKARLRWAKLKAQSMIPYAGSKGYRQMCRYMSGPIFHHPLLKDLDYYWRIEPQTKHTCTLQSFWKETNGSRREWVERDPFRYMRDNNKKYAWNIALKEYRGTVKTLMISVNAWRKENPALVQGDNAYSFVSDDGIGYNLCHFWTNFEIIDLSFVRGPAYTSYFEFLDKAGGFFYERWGDAPVRSIAAAMLLKTDELWKVEHAGYSHPPFSYCPRTLDPGQVCACDADGNIDYDRSFSSCQIKYDKIQGIDSQPIISALNAANGVLENFDKGEDPYVIKAPRLAAVQEA